MIKHYTVILFSIFRVSKSNGQPLWTNNSSGIKFVVLIFIQLRNRISLLNFFVKIKTYGIINIAFFSHKNTLLRFVRGRLKLDIAFRPHLPFGNTTLHKLQVGGALQPSLDVKRLQHHLMTLGKNWLNNPSDFPQSPVPSIPALPLFLGVWMNNRGGCLAQCPLTGAKRTLILVAEKVGF